ncbi:MAG TPA: hypothetical protein VFO76_04340, partial [Candidatus Kapabacteria bacterium]|nr:hypothetical protein [Candidatus Kapabacteria bacterium]
MAKTNTTGDGAGDRKELRTTELTEEQLRIEKIRKMTEEADNKRRLSDSEILFPAEPLPALVYADNPKARYDLWYGSIMRFKRLYLKGDGYLEVRREINKFMKE